jgi:hypothetical protein
MSFKDLEETWAKRAKKDVVEEAKDKGKRDQKRKSGTLEAEKDTVKTASRGQKRKSAALNTSELTNRIGRISKTPELAGASVAQTSGI